MKKVKIDNETCICCGSCVATCEDVFGWTDDGTACVKEDAKLEENKELVEKAIEQCPTSAIKYDE